MMGANILPLPAQLSSRSASSNPTPPSEFTGPPSLGVSISNLIARSARTVCIENQRFPRSRRDSIFKKLAGPRANAKRFLRLRSSGIQTHSQRPSVRPVSEIILSPTSVNLEDEMRSDSSSTEVLPRPVSEHTLTTETTTPFTPLRNEKIVATGSGISVGIALTEPVLYLQGYDQQDPSSKKSAILRGQMHLKVTKCVKIKKISVCFRGHAQTDWPDGIPPKKIHFHDKKDLFTHGVVYFNHGDTALMQNDYGAHYYQHAKPISSVPGKEGVTMTTRELFSNRNSAATLALPTAKDVKRLSLQANRGHSRSFSKNEPPTSQPQPQRNYRMFPVGDYLYSFEFPIDGSLPETINTDLGSVKYDLEAMVERSGAFRPNLLGAMEVPVIRTPAEGSLEQVEPIAISRNWEDQLHYDIVISGKSFPLGSQIPIAFKLTPLAKVECHRIKVYVTENIQHWTADKSVHRLQPAKKVLLFEKRADSSSVSTYPGSSMRVTAGGGIDWDHRAAAARGQEIVDRNRTNLLGNLSNDSGVGPTEMEFNVQLPSCHEMKGRDESQRLHFDTTYENIQINHWIKIVLRLSKVDERDPTKRRHFEISIDSPFHILSCKATQANIYLPAYTTPAEEPAPPAQEFECGCPGASLAPREQIIAPAISDREDSDPALATVTRRGSTSHNFSRSFTNDSGGLARPPQAHLATPPNDRNIIVPPRPMHLLRAPIVGDDREAVLEDYFSRLSFYEENEDDDRGRGRVDVPLTPGGRVNRSMDVPREWVRIEDYFQ
ncbi:Immunoglobulin E-set [Penicillium cf. griseofulvum]|nr:Immunoglobulin E-set [Penicillium cf. griseofulvum]